METTQVKQAAPPTVPKPELKIPKPKRKRRWLRVLIVLVVIAALAGWFLVRPILNASRQISNMLYTPSPAAYRDITVSVSGSATVQPADSYKVTALVKGEILDAPFEEGDRVEKGGLLYRIDSSDVENSIERSALSVEQSRISYENARSSRSDALENTELKAGDTGVIQKLYMEQGDTVSAGAPVADILDRSTMKLTVPFHATDAHALRPGESADIFVDGSAELLSGTVESIAAVDEAGSGGTLIRQVTLSVPNPGALSPSNTGTASVAGVDCAASGSFRYAASSTVTAGAGGKLERLLVSEGDRVTKGQVLCSFQGANLDSQVETARLNLRSAELALQSAKDQLESYTITSPISGTVVEKIFKSGDNLDATTSGYLAVIYDMSTLTFTLKVDELYISEIKVGQTVRITADALEGKSFTGRVSKLNINGVTTGGVTSYPVTVDIDDPGDLLPGMNVSAEILVEEASHILTVPVDAVRRGNTVQVLPADAYDKNGTPDYSRLKEVPVTLGRNDDNYIEILSGLNEGDVVVTQMSQTSLMEQMMSGGMGPGGTGAESRPAVNVGGAGEPAGNAP